MKLTKEEHMSMKIKIFFISLFIAACFSMGVKASDNLSNVEAMFIYNFLRHVNWPEGSGNENFVIGVYGNSDTYNQLVQFTANRKVGTKSIEIRRISSVAEAVSCQLIFVPAANISSITTIKSQVGNRACLIVGEQEGSNAHGSTIEFILKDNTLKFRINQERAKQQNLLVSRSLIDMSI